MKNTWKWALGAAVLIGVSLLLSKAVKASPKPKTAVPGAPVNDAPDFIVTQYDPVTGNFMYTWGGLSGTMTPIQSANGLRINGYMIDFTDYSSGVYQFLMKNSAGTVLRAGTINQVDTF